MSNCTSGCRTKDHASYGECLKDKGVRAVGVDISKGFDADTQKKWDKELDSYRAARAEGIQPAGTQQHHIDNAKRISDKTGTAWSA